jgi:hypothetical protein
MNSARYRDLNIWVIYHDILAILWLSAIAKKDSSGYWLAYQEARGAIVHLLIMDRIQTNYTLWRSQSFGWPFEPLGNEPV